MKNLADPTKITCAVHLREQGQTIAQIVEKTGVARSSLYRHMPPRPADGAVPATGRDVEQEPW